MSTAEIGIADLVRRAQLGDRQSMDRLAETVRQRLHAYIYRLTLNHDLTQDLLQETLLKMIGSIQDIEQPARFWGWLFRTALGIVQHHYRDRAREQRIEFSAVSRRRLSAHLSEEHEDGLSHAMRLELSHAIVEAMSQLRLSYRNVLTLRCYDQMPYAEIATTMDCKELRARVLFYRAKRALSRQLTKRGFGKGLLLTALGLFGLLTTPAEGTSTCAVAATSLHVGPLAALVGIAGTPAGLTAIMTVAGGTFVLTLEHFAYVLLVLPLIFVSLVIALYWE